MIGIFSQNRYLEYSLKTIPKYKSIDIFTSSNPSDFSEKNDLVVLDEMDEYVHKFKNYIAISKNDNSHISKPFHISKLVKLIDNALDTIKNTLRFKNFSFSFEKRLLTNKDMIVSLTEKEADLLQYLLKNSTLKLKKHSILKEIWGYENIETSTLETYISHLRKKFKLLEIQSFIIIKDEIISINI
ncbi:MAG: two-component SAPR family response regulator [Candidatus Midichloriaceae bacterium]|jgi:two-component SAPR family response regulator